MNYFHKFIKFSIANTKQYRVSCISFEFSEIVVLMGHTNGVYSSFRKWRGNDISEYLTVANFNAVKIVNVTFSLLVRYKD